MDGVSLLIEARRAGLQVRAEGDCLVIRGPRRLEPLALKLLAYKQAVLAALRGCPTCGATPEELELVCRRRALDEALAAYERHKAECTTCRSGPPWCDEGRGLRRRYLDCWLAWQSWRQEEVDWP